MSFDLFGVSSNDDQQYTISKNGEDKHIINISPGEMKKILAANSLYSIEDEDWFSKFNRYGWVYPSNETANREFLFFTKPELNIFANDNNAAYSSLLLNEDLKTSPIFTDAMSRYKPSLTQLQSSVRDCNDTSNNFMCILSNAVTSKLDLPGISAESIDTVSNVYGASLSYRSHSLKSDNGYDFNLSFTDSKFMPIYMIAKLYDEYMRLQRLGYVAPKKKYIVNRILTDQFSVYKFIVAADGETILYFAKLTGVYFTDVPRGDFGDPNQDGFKYSLSFHAQFVEDNNPSILSDFNIVCGAVEDTANGKMANFYNKRGFNTANVYDMENSMIDNEWVSAPYIIRVENDVRAARARRYDNMDYLYMLKWRR